MMVAVRSRPAALAPLPRAHRRVDDEGEAGAWIGLASGVAGIAGTLTGGLVSHRMVRRDATAM
jgi:hypothetical protein